MIFVTSIPLDVGLYVVSCVGSCVFTCVGSIVGVFRVGSIVRVGSPVGGCREYTDAMRNSALLTMRNIVTNISIFFS